MLGWWERWIFLEVKFTADLVVVSNMGVNPKNRGGKPPKMDGLFHGKPYFLMDYLRVPLFLETPIYFLFHPYLGK